MFSRDFNDGNLHLKWIINCEHEWLIAIFQSKYVVYVFAGSTVPTVPGGSEMTSSSSE